MPDKPIWYTRLEVAIKQLETLPSPWVDRAALEFALGVGRRRAQQILQPLVRHTIGKNGLADREEVIRIPALTRERPACLSKLPPPS